MRRIAPLFLALVIVLAFGDVASAQCGSGVGFRSRSRTVVTTTSACAPAATTTVYHLPAQTVVPVPNAAPAMPTVVVTAGGCSAACAPATSARTVIRIRQR